MCHAVPPAPRVITLMCRPQVSHAAPGDHSSGLPGPVCYGEGFAVPAMVPGTLLRTLAALCDVIEAAADPRSLAF